jgi:hypothetical protein
MGMTLEEAGQQVELTYVDVERDKAWRKICGLLDMDEGRCVTCPCARLNGSPTVRPSIRSVPSVMLSRPRKVR